MKYSVRCRHQACRVRKVVPTHPDDMQAVQCDSCKNTKGWREERRDYNRQGLCNCDGPCIGQEHGKAYPHRTSHPLCDQHPQGHRNQALARGVAAADLPIEHMGAPCTSEEAPF